MSAAPRRALSARVVLALAGTAVSSYGYLLTTAAHVGNGPIFALQQALHQRAGVSLGVAAVLAGLALAALAAVLRAPFGPGPVVIPILTGLSVALLEPLTPHVDGVVLRCATFAIGTVVMMLGAVMIVGGRFGASAVDAAMFGIARVTGTPPATARIGMECVFAALGFALGGQVGPGTVVMALSVGPLFALWSRVFGWDREVGHAEHVPEAVEPYSRRRASAIALAASRSDWRAARSWRLSTVVLPLPRAISTFTLPFEK